MSSESDSYMGSFCSDITPFPSDDAQSAAGDSGHSDDEMDLLSYHLMTEQQQSDDLQAALGGDVGVGGDSGHGHTAQSFVPASTHAHSHPSHDRPPSDWMASHLQQSSNKENCDSDGKYVIDAPRQDQLSIPPIIGSGSTLSHRTLGMCAICDRQETRPSNRLITCATCEACVHQLCYGVSDIGMARDGKWDCVGCAEKKHRLLDTEDKDAVAVQACVTAVQCAVCPVTTGLLKPLSDPLPEGGEFAHLTCCIWVPEMFIGDDTTMSPICGTEKVHKDRINLRCIVCKQRGYRGAVQCCYNRCVTAFHVECGRRAGLTMRLLRDEDSGSVIAVSYCQAHAEVAIQELAEKWNDAPCPVIDPATTDAYYVDALLNRRRAPLLAGGYEYQVRWRWTTSDGKTETGTTWERRNDLTCPGLMATIDATAAVAERHIDKINKKKDKESRRQHRRQQAHLRREERECSRTERQKLKEDRRFEKRRLKALARVTERINADSDSAVCSICNDGDVDDDDDILFCDRCNVAVHQQCYVVPRVPDGEWLCRPCEQNVMNPKCAACYKHGGAFRPTSCHQWCHVMCAMWFPELSFQIPEQAEPIVGIDTLVKSRFNLKCEVCGERSGACIQCKIPSCVAAFHPVCAMLAGYQMDFKTGKQGSLLLVHHCSKHTPFYLDDDDDTEGESNDSDSHNSVSGSDSYRSSSSETSDDDGDKKQSKIGPGDAGCHLCHQTTPSLGWVGCDFGLKHFYCGVCVERYFKMSFVTVTEDPSRWQCPKCTAQCPCTPCEKQQASITSHDKPLTVPASPVASPPLDNMESTPTRGQVVYAAHSPHGVLKPRGGTTASGRRVISKSLTTGNEEVCDVCMDGDSFDGNEIVFCDKCNIPVHQACYGIDEIPKGEWLCLACHKKQYNNEVITCALCPVKGGAMKPATQPGVFAHVTCGLWTPETCFENVDKMEPIDGIDRIDKARFRLRCSICLRPSGSCIQCSCPSCTIAYHPLCARAASFKMIIVDDMKHGCRMLSFCSKHTLAVNVLEQQVGDGDTAAIQVAGVNTGTSHSLNRGSRKQQDVFNKLQQRCSPSSKLNSLKSNNGKNSSLSLFPLPDVAEGKGGDKDGDKDEARPSLDGECWEFYNQYFEYVLSNTLETIDQNMVSTVLDAYDYDTEFKHEHMDSTLHKNNMDDFGNNIKEKDGSIGGGEDCGGGAPNTVVSSPSRASRRLRREGPSYDASGNTGNKGTACQSTIQSPTHSSAQSTVQSIIRSTSIAPSSSKSLSHVASAIIELHYMTNNIDYDVSTDIIPLHNSFKLSFDCATNDITIHTSPPRSNAESPFDQVVHDTPSSTMKCSEIGLSITSFIPDVDESDELLSEQYLLQDQLLSLRTLNSKRLLLLKYILLNNMNHETLTAITTSDDGCICRNYFIHYIKKLLNEPRIESVADNNDVCNLCGDGGKLICCDGCPAVYHCGCMNPPRTCAPVGEWFCFPCQSRKRCQKCLNDRYNIVTEVPEILDLLRDRVITKVPLVGRTSRRRVLPPIGVFEETIAPTPNLYASSNGYAVDSYYSGNNDGRSGGMAGGSTYFPYAAPSCGGGSLPVGGMTSYGKAMLNNGGNIYNNTNSNGMYGGMNGGGGGIGTFSSFGSSRAGLYQLSESLLRLRFIAMRVGVANLVRELGVTRYRLVRTLEGYIPVKREFLLKVDSWLAMHGHQYPPGFADQPNVRPEEDSIPPPLVPKFPVMFEAGDEAMQGGGGYNSGGYKPSGGTTHGMPTSYHSSFNTSSNLMTVSNPILPSSNMNGRLPPSTPTPSSLNRSTTTSVHPSKAQQQQQQQQKSTKKEQKNQICDDRATDSDDDGLYCFCRRPYEDNIFMIACDYCNEWYHPACVGLTDAFAKSKFSKTKYQCPGCLAAATAEAKGDDPAATNVINKKNKKNEKNDDDGVDDDVKCAVCLVAEEFEDDEIILCDVCDVAVHQCCYGIADVPRGPWVCRPCAAIVGRASSLQGATTTKDVKCAACYRNGGALKPTTDGKWCHVACAMWLPELSFVDVDIAEPIDGVQNLKAARLNLKCCICKEKGSCVQCDAANCYVSWHILCGLEQGYDMDDNTKVKRCSKHGVVKDRTLVIREQLALEKSKKGSSVSRPLVESRPISEKTVTKNESIKLKPVIEAVSEINFDLVPCIPSTRDAGEAQDSLCSVCFINDSRYIVTCDQCGVAAHPKCVAIPEPSRRVSHHSWLCFVCKDGDSCSSRQRMCSVCGCRQGIMYPLAPTDIQSDIPSSYVHVACSQWFQQLSVDPATHQVAGVLNISKEQRRLKCTICHGAGACIQCSYGRCCTAFHPICALAAHHQMDLLEPRVCLCTKHHKEHGKVVVSKPIKINNVVQHHLNDIKNNNNNNNNSNGKSNKNDCNISEAKCVKRKQGASSVVASPPVTVESCARRKRSRTSADEEVEFMTAIPVSPAGRVRARPKKFENSILPSISVLNPPTSPVREVSPPARPRPSPSRGKKRSRDDTPHDKPSKDKPNNKQKLQNKIVLIKTDSNLLVHQSKVDKLGLEGAIAMAQCSRSNTTDNKNNKNKSNKQLKNMKQGRGKKEKKKGRKSTLLSPSKGRSRRQKKMEKYVSDDDDVDDLDDVDHDVDDDVEEVSFRASPKKSKQKVEATSSKNKRKGKKNDSESESKEEGENLIIKISPKKKLNDNSTNKLTLKQLKQKQKKEKTKSNAANVESPKASPTRATVVKVVLKSNEKKKTLIFETLDPKQLKHKSVVNDGRKRGDGRNNKKRRKMNTPMDETPFVSPSPPPSLSLSPARQKRSVTRVTNKKK